MMEKVNTLLDLLAERIGEAARACTDADLLDLVLKLLLEK